MKTFLYRLTMKLIALLIVRELSLACARENNTTNIPTTGPKKALTAIARPKNEKVSLISCDGGICICRMLSVGAKPLRDNAPRNKKTSNVPSASVTGRKTPALPRIAEKAEEKCLGRDCFRMVDIIFSF